MEGKMKNGKNLCGQDPTEGERRRGIHNARVLKKQQGVMLCLL